jgi:hypothetical protein
MPCNADIELLVKDTEDGPDAVRPAARWKNFKKVNYYIPGTAWIPNYSISL